MRLAGVANVQANKKIKEGVKTEKIVTMIACIITRGQMM